MLEGVLSMQNLISDPVSMTSCRQEAYLLRLRRQFPFVYVKTLTRTAFGRSVYALQFGSGSRKLLITAGHHANETITSDAVWQWLFTFCNALLDGEADIALVTSPVSLPGSVRRTSLSSFQELLVGGRQFAALAQGAHTLRELTQYPWIGLRRGTQTHAWHTQLFLREQLIYCPDVEAATAAQLLPLLLRRKPSLTLS